MYYVTTFGSENRESFSDRSSAESAAMRNYANEKPSVRVFAGLDSFGEPKYETVWRLF